MSVVEVVEGAVEACELNDVESAEDVACTIDTVELVQQFREMIVDLELEEHLKTDIELLRWIKARSFDLNEAEKMLRRSIQWRRDYEMHKIMSFEPPEHFLVDFPFQICGFDHDGDQFGVVTYSKWKIDSFLDAVPVDKAVVHMRYFWKCLELIKHVMRNHSTEEKTIYNGIVIVDLDGLHITQFIHRLDILEVILDTTRKYEANYPGFLKKAVVVNTPKLFTMLWSLMRPFLSEETLSCVEIFGYYDDWKSVLRNILPHDQLPARYGGANTVPITYHPSQGYRVLPVEPVEIEESELKSTTVPAGQKLDIDFQIADAGTKLSWAFKTDDYDIGFGVFHCANNEEIEVVDFCRVDSHILMQKGSLVCQNPGKYIVRFDNISSWIRPKMLYYKIKTDV